MIFLIEYLKLKFKSKYSNNVLINGLARYFSRPS